MTPTKTSVFFTSGKLLLNALKQSETAFSTLLIDATYKTNFFNLQLVCLGTVDRKRKYRLLGLFFTSSELKEDYADVLNFLRQSIEKRIGVKYHPKSVISDSSDAIIWAVNKVFNQNNDILHSM